MKRRFVNIRHVHPGARRANASAKHAANAGSARGHQHPEIAHVDRSVTVPVVTRCHPGRIVWLFRLK
jgi:hypothetical protein